MQPMKPHPYACTTLLLALISRAPSQARKSGVLPWLRPDAKSQVTFVYEDGKPVAIDAVVLSTSTTLILNKVI